MAYQPESALWQFRCPRGCPEFDVWGHDWSEVAKADRPAALQDAIFEPEDVLTTRCPSCLRPARPIGPRETLA